MQRDRVLLAEMIEAAERIVQLVGTSSGDEVAASRDRRDAALWNFAVLGEAAGQISEATRAGHPDVGWRDPVRVRNRIIHGYASVDMDILAAAAQDDIPELLGQLRAIASQLATAEAGPDPI